jgi:hypothetical protein
MALSELQEQDSQRTRGSLHPSLYQVNTRVLLRELSGSLGRPATLDDIPDRALDVWAATGFEWLWLLSVWQTGLAGQAISRASRDWRRAFKEVLPDLRDADIAGSGFAISSYTVHRSLGGPAALARLRNRMRQRGLRLMLDFVPNHTAVDHRWVAQRPNYYISGTERSLTEKPGNYARIRRKGGDLVLAHGRDPNFPGWPDTLQLNYSKPALRDAMTKELERVAHQCDGVRCDMAMLLLPDIFRRTWGITPEPFWPKAIPAVHAKHPAFTFMAEVYWDLEWTLQQQGFDYCYDKRLYDRLRDGHAAPIRGHLVAGLDYQDKLVRFLENHDEPRAASEFPWPQHQAAAIVTFLSPGLRFFYQAQSEGARVRVPTHLCRGPVEATNPEIAAFYHKLLGALTETDAFRNGIWTQIQPQPAWPGNWTSDDFIAYAWTGADGANYVVVVNYAGNRGQCRLPLPFPEFRGKRMRLADVLGTEVYDRDGSDLVDNGLFIDHAPWHFNVFELRAI